jgi:hypothetical protein
MRVMRLIIYEGPAEKIVEVLNKSVQGKRVFGTKMELSITAITLGTVPNELTMSLEETIDESD